MRADERLGAYAAERKRAGQKSGGRGRRKTRGSHDPQVPKSTDAIGAMLALAGRGLVGSTELGERRAEKRLTEIRRGC
jgi:hypothetical protein